MNKFLLCCLLCFSLLMSMGWSQTYTASLRGTVTDVSKAVIPGASVVVTETSRNLKYTAQTDTTGRYMLTALPREATRLWLRRRASGPTPSLPLN